MCLILNYSSLNTLPKPAINNSLSLAFFRIICFQLVKSTFDFLPKASIAVSKFIAISWNVINFGKVEESRIAIIRALRKFVPILYVKITREH
jgi:hypothetical protein